MTSSISIESQRSTGLRISTGIAAAVASSALFWFYRNKQKSKASIPWIPSVLPYVGCGLSYFKSVLLFNRNNRQRYGDTFYATIFGYRWLFVHHEKDIRMIVSSNERSISMYQALGLLVGKFFPNDDVKGYLSPQSERLISRGKHWDGISATPIFVQALKPQILRSWIPSLRNLLRNDLESLPDSGTVDLFAWCNDLISAITTRVQFGDYAKDRIMAQTWIDLVRKAEPEAAFDEPGWHTLKSLWDIIRFGERREYAIARDFIKPYLDAEIQKCIAAGDNAPDNDSVLASLVYHWYHTRLDKNAQYLQDAHTRIANDFFLFTFAAVTNSFAAAAWVLYHMIRNSANIREKVMQDLAQDKTDALEKVIYEIARLYTPGSLFRYVAKDFELPSNSALVKKGTIVSFNVAAAHRNKDAFSNPCEFHPNRFDSGGDERSTSLYLPFGAGSHPCVGKRFAVLEITLFVSEALEQFDWELEEQPASSVDELTSEFISNISGHPKLDMAQNNSIWRPVEPIMVRYRRKSGKTVDGIS